MDIEIIEGSALMNYNILQHLNSKENSIEFVYTNQEDGCTPMPVPHAVILNCRYSKNKNDIDKFCDLIYNYLSDKNVKSKLDYLLILSEQKREVAEIMKKYFQENYRFYDNICNKIVISAWNQHHFTYPKEYEKLVLLEG